MFRKTLNLFFGVLLAIASGTVMTYPMYSYYIKTKLHHKNMYQEILPNQNKGHTVLNGAEMFLMNILFLQSMI